MKLSVSKQHYRESKMGRGHQTSRPQSYVTGLEVLLEAKNDRIAELQAQLEAAEAEIKELRSRLEAADLESWLDSQ